MTGNGARPVVHLLKKVYKTGVTLTDDDMDAYEARLERSKTLPKWDVMIQPVLGPTESTVWSKTGRHVRWITLFACQIRFEITCYRSDILPKN